MLRASISTRSAVHGKIKRGENIDNQETKLRAKSYTQDAKQRMMKFSTWVVTMLFHDMINVDKGS